MDYITEVDEATVWEDDCYDDGFYDDTEPEYDDIVDDWRSEAEYDF